MPNRLLCPSKRHRGTLSPAIAPWLADGFALPFIQRFHEVTMTTFIASPTTVTLPMLMLVIDRLYGLERLFVGETAA